MSRKSAKCFPASGVWAPAAALPLLALAHIYNLEVPGDGDSNPVPKILWNYVMVWNIEKRPAATFCKKPTKASDRKQADDRN